MIRQWDVPTMHAKILPPKAKDMLNKNACQVGIQFDQSVLRSGFIHSLTEGRQIKQLLNGSIRSAIHVI